jgi:hypothetical protein
MYDQNYFDVLTSLVSKTVEDVILHPVSLKLVWKLVPSDTASELKGCDFTSSLESLDPMCLSLFIPKIYIFGWDAVLLPKRKLKMYTIQDLEVRKDDSPLKFSDADFVYEIDNLLGITLKDLTEACYRLKTFKYNYKDEVITNLRLIEESYDSYVVKLVFKRD